MGDPYAIPLGLLPLRYEEAIDALLWERGDENAEDRQDEREMQRDVKRLKRMRRRQVISRVLPQQ